MRKSKRPRVKRKVAMGPYPDLRPALPTHYIRTSRTKKLLSPAIVLVTVIALAVMSLMELVVTIVVLMDDGMRSGSEMASVGFGIIAVSGLLFICP